MGFMKKIGRGGPPLPWRGTALGAVLIGAGFAVGVPSAQAAITCTRNITADVVAIDMPIVNNRLGASNVNGMMYALKRDVLDLNGPGLPRLRDDKRPRPLVLRVAAGDCLTINFENHVAPLPNPRNAPLDLDGIGNDPNPATANGIPQINVPVDEQVADRRVGFHAAGMQLRGSIASDGSFVGRNPSSLVAPGASTVYQLYAEKEGVFQIVSHGALVGSDANQGNVANGLFGQIIVEPRGARTYRNTVTEEEMRLATRVQGGQLRRTPQGHPVLNYEARFPNNGVWAAEGKAGIPVLNMMDCANQNTGPCTIVHTEVDAVVAGPNADGSFPPATYPHEARNRRNPAYPNRLEPFRDFAQVWHDEVANAQAFPGFYNAGFLAPGATAPDALTPVFAYLLKGVRDKFMINYAAGGIGTEILANRLGVGPMHDCLNCAYEEFFLTHFTVGEIGQLVDIPANQGLETITPQNVLNILLFLKNGTPALTAEEAAFVAAMGPKATKALYPGDPANINHSYTGDAIKFRNTHNGFEQHVFHLHNHQWLFNPNDDNSNYLDAQGIGPGMGYTYEIAMGGSGNRNKSAGDAIFHCHFYPHFAQGMWYMWRHHDVMETGTPLAVSNGGFHTVPFALQDGTPAAGARALPDGEIAVGTPIPAVVPLPGKPLPPMPSATVTVKAMDRDGNGTPDSSQAIVDRSNIRFDGTWNPGYPFWVGGIACEDDGTVCDQGTVGQRPPTPPLDMVTRAQAQAMVDPVTGVAPFNTYDAAMKANFVSLAGDYTQMHGGLPRHTLHGVKAGGAAGPTVAGVVSPVDLTKFVEKAKPNFLPEGGTDIERAAMSAHATLLHTTSRVLPNGAVQAAQFQLNGRPAVPGAVYSDPCRDDTGNPIQSNGSNTFFGGATRTAMIDLPTGPFGAYAPRVYRGANIQYDAVLNKVGYHYPQQRIVSLWEDALPVIEKNKPGEPLVMRLNTFDCAMYHHTNLVPETYEMDDYQLRTPTDIIGQHIHLPKWDLTTTDGAGNGWNYEDGTIAGGAIRERIHAVNKFNAEQVCEGHAEVLPAETAGTEIVTVNHVCPAGTANAGNTVVVSELVEQPHAFFGATGPGGVDWRGTRITLQRWFADPLLNVQGVDRGLGIIFTHDHYGPSTFQQIGLYSTVLIEPARSQWAHAERGEQLGCVNPGEYPAGATATAARQDQVNRCRYDGGPTSWQAIIDTAASGPGGDIDNDGKNDSFREFYFEYTDFQHAYEPGVYVGAGNRGEYNGAGDEKAYIEAVPGVGAALADLFYETIAAAPAPGSFPGSLNTFRFSIAPPLIVPNFPIFPDLTYELAVNLGNGALSRPAAAVPDFVEADPGNQPFVRACIQRPCPTSIDFLEPGLFVVNYRNEPVGLRVFDPAATGPDGKPGAQATGDRGDLAFAFQSRTDRAIGALNVMPAQGAVAVPPLAATTGAFPVEAANIAVTAFPPHINDAGFGPGDPFTPMLRTYSGDRVRIKAQAGGDEEEHSWSIHGIKWTQAGSGHGRAPHSGWRNQQAGGISEQFTAAAPVFQDFGQTGGAADYLYFMDAHQDGVWTGNWGVMRNYNELRADLAPLPNNVRPVQPLNRVAFQAGDRAVCPRVGPDLRPTNNVTFNISAVLANDVLPQVAGVTVTPTGDQVLAAGTPLLQQGQLPQNVDIATLHAGGPLPGTGTLVYNKRTTPVTGTAQGIVVNETGPLHDPTAMMYVLDSDLGPDGKLLANVPVEPLMLRVNAGDCVTINLTNRLPADRAAPDLPNYNDIRHVVKRDRAAAEGATTFSNNLIRPSSNVGFHSQMLEYDVTRSDGTNVGINPVQTAAPGAARTYTFYAGDLRLAEVPQIGDPNRFNLDVVLSEPVEFGGANVLPADRMKQPQKGLFGQIIVEPRNATVSFPDPTTRASADVTAPAANGVPAQSYRDFALVWQKMMNYRYASGNAVQNESEEGPGLPENPPHTILSGANYRAEPTFFRFGIPPLAAAGGAACSPLITAPKPANPADPTCFGSVVNAGSIFSNTLTGGADPEVPIFNAAAGRPFRIHLTLANSSNRGSTFQLHGHVWPRDPYLARDRDANGFPRQLAGQALGGVPSVRIGDNPMQMYFGAQESIIGSAHFSFVMPSAGGGDAIPGDYLFRDTAAAGFSGGAWGILRVQ